MYKLPDDVTIKLLKKYENKSIKNEQELKTFIDELFSEIVNKTLSDGSCGIREFGTFTAFRTFSNRVKKNVVRFKFERAWALNNRLKTDQYAIENLPIEAAVPFTEAHESICENKRDNRNDRILAIAEAKRLGKEKTKEHLVKQDILEMLNNPSIINPENQYESSDKINPID